MDDEAMQLLREMRDLLIKADIRDTEWMEEMRKRYEDATVKNFKVARWNAWTVWFLLGALIAVCAASAFVQFRSHGVF